MKILVTGFDPFGGEKVNPSYEAVKLLPPTIAGAEIIKLEVPTIFSKCGSVVEQTIQQYQPDVVLNVGQAGRRSQVTVEKVAINFVDAKIPDNDGKKPSGVSVQDKGETAYFATIPINAMVENVIKHGLPCAVSYTAGSFVCNYLMYTVLYMIAQSYPNIRAGFIHVPLEAGQVIGKPDGTAFMSRGDIAKSLEYAIEAIVTGKNVKNESK